MLKTYKKGDYFIDELSTEWPKLHCSVNSGTCEAGPELVPGDKRRRRIDDHQKESFSHKIQELRGTLSG